jgi:hypothetical protein
MAKVISSIWHVAPELGIPESPAILAESDTLWVAYFKPQNETLAVVRFTGLIDHRLAPINDQGLGRHRYVASGLQPYSFNELVGTEETQYWRALAARHWVITCKDQTLDVIARGGEVVSADVAAISPFDALMLLLSKSGQRVS